MHWKTIDTAPRDGRFFIGGNSEEVIMCNWPKQKNVDYAPGNWRRGRGEWNGSMILTRLPLTHWMQLPEPPTSCPPTIPTIPPMILTRNTAQLRQVVEEHVAADAVIQSDCFDVTFCLNHSNDPVSAEKEYGLPIMVQRIADSIFERLPVEDALKFLAALPDAIGCDGKDLSRVAWKFLAQTLRNMPLQPAKFQAVVDPVIAGLELLAAGGEWPNPAADAARWAAVNAATAAAAEAADASADAHRAAWAIAEAAFALAEGAWAAAGGETEAAWQARTAARRRQRDLLLQLISKAPVV